MDNNYKCPKCGADNSLQLAKLPRKMQVSIAKAIIAGEGIIVDCCKCKKILFVKIKGRLNAVAA